MKKARAFEKSTVVLAITCRKMAENTTMLSKREKRRERERERRVDTFGMEYVRVKYPNIYNEIMNFYKKTQENYPNKCDLRKTQEFKWWKLNQEKKEQATCQPQIPKPPATSIPKPPKEQATCQPQIPKPPATSIPKPPATFDNLELRIPLWDTATLTSAQTLQTVAEEVLGEGTIYPLLQDEISNDLIEKILEELREDPDLKDIFNTVEEEFEQLGAEITINEDNRLENELALW